MEHASPSQADIDLLHNIEIPSEIRTQADDILREFKDGELDVTQTRARLNLLSDNHLIKTVFHYDLADAQRAKMGTSATKALRLVSQR